MLGDAAKRREYDATGRVVRSVEDEFVDRHGWGWGAWTGGRCWQAVAGVAEQQSLQALAALPSFPLPLQ